MADTAIEDVRIAQWEQAEGGACVPENEKEHLRTLSSFIRRASLQAVNEQLLLAETQGHIRWRENDKLRALVEEQRAEEGERQREVKELRASLEEAEKATAASKKTITILRSALKRAAHSNTKWFGRAMEAQEACQVSEGEREELLNHADERLEEARGMRKDDQAELERAVRKSEELLHRLKSVEDELEKARETQKSDKDELARSLHKNGELKNRFDSVEGEFDKVEARLSKIDQALIAERSRAAEVAQGMKREKVQLRASMTSGQTRIRKAEKSLKDEHTRRMQAEGKAEKLKIMLQTPTPEVNALKSRLQQVVEECAGEKRKREQSEHDTNQGRQNMRAQVKRARTELEEEQRIRAEAESLAKRRTAEKKSLKAELKKTELTTKAETEKLKARLDAAERTRMEQEEEFRLQVRECSKKLQLKTLDAQTQITCIFCMEKPIAMLFDPCGHVVSCEECGVTVDKCPVCQSPVKAKLKAFLP